MQQAPGIKSTPTPTPTPTPSSLHPSHASNRAPSLHPPSPKLPLTPGKGLPIDLKQHLSNIMDFTSSSRIQSHTPFIVIPTIFGEIYILNPHLQQIYILKGHNKGVYAACQVGDMRICTGCFEGIINFWDLRLRINYRSIQCGYQTHIRCLCNLSHELLAVSIPHEIRIYNTYEGVVLLRIETADSEGFIDYVTSFLLHSSGLLFFGTQSGRLRIYDLDGGLEIQARNLEGKVVGIVEITDRKVMTGLYNSLDLIIFDPANNLKSHNFCDQIEHFEVMHLSPSSINGQLIAASRNAVYTIHTYSKEPQIHKILLLGDLGITSIGTVMEIVTDCVFIAETDKCGIVGVNMLTGHPFFSNKRLKTDIFVKLNWFWADT